MLHGWALFLWLHGVVAADSAAIVLRLSLRVTGPY